MRYPPLDMQPTVIYSGRSRYDADTDTVYVDIRPGAVAPHIVEMHELGHWYGVHTGMIPKYLTSRKDEISAELYALKYAAHQLRERGSWAAGIMDGEGTIRIKTSGHDNYQIILAVGNTDGRIIDCIYDNWGGYVHHKTAGYLSSHRRTESNNRKDGYTLYFSDYNQSVDFLLDITPYLMIKKEYAKLILRALFILGEPPPGLRRRRHGVSKILEPLYQEMLILDAIEHKPLCPIAKSLE